MSRIVQDDCPLLVRTVLHEVSKGHERIQVTGILMDAACRHENKKNKLKTHFWSHYVICKCTMTSRE